MPYINNTVMLVTDIAIWVGLNLWWDYLRDNRLKKAAFNEYPHIPPPH